MQKNLPPIHEHMQLLGRSSLAHALTLLITPTNDSDYGYYQSELAVLMAAHAAEILLKARIAEEHPLLIFDKLPTSKDADFLEIKALFQSGKTIQYSQIPERLWATTGYKLKKLHLYKNFGELRNNIQHFAPSKSPNYLTWATLDYIFSVIDPFLQDCWNGYAITCFEHPEYSTEQSDLIQSLYFWEIDFKYPVDYEDRVMRAKEVVANWSHKGRDVLERESAKKVEAFENPSHIWPQLWRKKTDS